MTETFDTFKPEHELVSQFVDYYYLDVKPSNDVTEFVCFPHHNTTISLYKNHRRELNQDMVFDPQAGPFQIFTPVREEVLRVRQIGQVHRIVIVFHALGIQQFYRGLDFSDYILDHPFLNREELAQLFTNTEVEALTETLDQFLWRRYVEFNNEPLAYSTAKIFANYEEFSVEGLAQDLQMSRRHLNRLFNQHLGVSIKKFHKIVLLRKLLEKKLFSSPQETFTRLAYELNFSDQAHLNKAFKALTQNSPNQFLKKGTLLGDEDTFWHILK